MDKKSKLFKKVTSVLGVAIAALTGTQVNAQEMNFDDFQMMNDDNDAIQISNKKSKPMPVLKLNMSNPDDSTFIASHRSHSSHSSHSSHRSHSSHYSGR